MPSFAQAGDHYFNVDAIVAVVKEGPEPSLIYTAGGDGERSSSTSRAMKILRSTEVT